MNFYGAAAAGKIGPTGQHSFSNGSSNRVQVIAFNQRATMFILRATADTYIRQGDSSVTATTSDILLRAGNYFAMMVEGVHDSYLACYGNGAAGTLHYTNVSRLE
jgi:hypothetical protein